MHLIIQYYNDPDPARQKELDRCVESNLNSTFLGKVHCLIEPQTILPEALSNHSKIAISNNCERLTFASAFDYANRSIPDGEVVMIANLDVFLPETCEAWGEISTTHLGGVYDPALSRSKRIALCLSRYELDKDDKPYKHPISYIGHSQDAWVIQTPINYEAPCDFFVGNAPTCDNKIAWVLSQSGYDIWNWASRYRIHHLDLVRRNGEVRMEPTSTSDMQLRLRQDLKNLRVCPRFNYKYSLNETVSPKNDCDTARPHFHPDRTQPLFRFLVESMAEFCLSVAYKSAEEVGKFYRRVRRRL